ncbi:MAG: porin family protein [Gammaproteobacteria bacterium]|nr:porin family protein [Gammaproteobacteria bacterium]
MRAGTIKGLLAATFLTFSAAASADGYFAIEGSAMSLVSGADSGGSENEVSPGGLRMRLGTPISELLDLEGHLGFSFDDENDQFDEISASYYGAYLKAYLPVGYSSALFALGGLTSVNIDQSIGSSRFSDDRTGVSYGFGLETQLTENADLTADYMSYLRDEGLFEEITSFNFGLKLYF